MSFQTLVESDFQKITDLITLFVFSFNNYNPAC